MSLFEPECEPECVVAPRAAAVRLPGARTEFRDGVLAALPGRTNQASQQEATCPN